MKKSLLLSLVAASSLFASNVTLDRFTQDNQFKSAEGFRSFTTSGFDFNKVNGAKTKEWNLKEELIYSPIESLDVFVGAHGLWMKDDNDSSFDFKDISLGATYKLDGVIDNTLLAFTYETLAYERTKLADETKNESLKEHTIRLDARYFGVDNLGFGGYFAYNIDSHTGADDTMAFGANGSYKINDMFTIDAGVNDKLQKVADEKGDKKYKNFVHLNAGTTISFTDAMKLAVGTGIGLAEADTTKAQANVSFWVNF